METLRRIDLAVEHLGELVEGRKRLDQSATGILITELDA